MARVENNCDCELLTDIYALLAGRTLTEEEGERITDFVRGAVHVGFVRRENEDRG